MSGESVDVRDDFTNDLLATISDLRIKLQAAEARAKEAERFLPLIRRLERLTYYDTAPGYYREGDVANGAATRPIMLQIREMLKPAALTPTPEPPQGTPAGEE